MCEVDEQVKNVEVEAEVEIKVVKKEIIEDLILECEVNYVQKFIKDKEKDVEEKEVGLMVKESKEEIDGKVEDMKSDVQIKKFKVN